MFLRRNTDYDSAKAPIAMSRTIQNRLTGFYANFSKKC